MKIPLLAFLAALSIIVLFAFQVANSQTDESTAKVNKIGGFYIYTDSMPIMPYDSLGIIETGFITGTQYEQIRNNLIKRAKSKFPNANGLIMKFDKKGIDKCTVIKLIQ
jgi:hypothetical protein